MSIFNKMVNSLNNSTEKKEFCDRVNNLAFIYKETQKVLSPVNNIYWCFNLNLNYEEPFSRQELLMTFTKFSSYISQIISSHNELNALFNSNQAISSSCVEPYNKLNKMYSTLMTDLETLIKNYKTMDNTYPSERNKYVIKNLELGLARLQDFVQTNNVVGYNN